MKDKVLNFLQREIELQHIPGAVIHVSHQGRKLFQEGIGHRVVYPEKAPMDVNTVFDLASLTKVVGTLPAILKLIDDGDVRLDDRVAYFSPDFGQHGKEEITLRHLLTHTAGLPAHRSFYLEDLTSEQVFTEICSEQLVSPIGSKVIYSDLGFITLYKVIESVTNEKFENFIQTEIFTPLEMFDTTFNPTFTRERYAATEFSGKLNNYKHGIVHDENTELMGGKSGHAGLFSTMTDLSNYALMVENNGVFNGKRILSSSVLELSRKNFSPFDHEFRGLGWMAKSPALSSCGDLFSEKSYGHTGFTGTSIWFDPTIHLHVILLTNRVHYGRNSQIIRLRPRLHNIIRSHF